MHTLVSFMFVTSALYAQNTNSGDVRGTVRDTSGAVIPGVTVQVQEVDKEAVKTYITNGASLYYAGSITPDHYLLTFTAKGFASFVRGPVIALQQLWLRYWWVYHPSQAMLLLRL
jgi:hypothetical protein